MSIDAKPRHYRQRRLGILRNSHPQERRTLSPSVVKNSALISQLPVHYDVTEKIVSVSSSLSKEIYQEKLKRLHQIRIENAVIKMRTQSASDVSRKGIISPDCHELRCSTAPTYGTVKEFLKEKLCSSSDRDSDAVFDDKLSPPLSLQAIRRGRLATFPNLDHMQNKPTNQLPTTPLQQMKEKRGKVYFAKWPPGNDVSPVLKGALVTNSRKVCRTTSAPAEVCRVARIAQPEDITPKRTNHNRPRHLPHSSLIIALNNARRRQKASILGKNSTNRQYSSIANMSCPSEEVVTVGDGPLGIVGESCRSNRPQVFYKPPYKLPLRRPGLSNLIKTQQKLSQSPNEGIATSKTVLVVPSQPPDTPQLGGCACRSVRFNCTDNLVHEYLATEPVAVDNPKN